METQPRRGHRKLPGTIVLAIGAAGSLAVTGALPAVAAGPPRIAAPARTVNGHALPARTHVTGQAVRLTVVPSGSVAHYRVREQLTFFSFPTDAVGTTHAVSGAVVLDAHDRIVPAKSRITVDLRTLKTDQSRRDQYVQSNVLQTSSYPLAVFAVKKATGLPAHLPATGKLTFTLAGNLTVHGVTRSTTWAVTATLGRKSVTGTASTHFAMTDFDITPPQIGPVLSVQNHVTLDVTLQLARAALAHA